MKQVKYIGQEEVLIPLYNTIVKNGDVIGVQDDFVNALFQDVIPQPQPAPNPQQPPQGV